MRPTSFLQFQQSPVSLLVRPWKRERDGSLFYGLVKSGSKRHALTTKQGNKNFYKGTRSSGVGRHTNKNRYIINWEKVRTFVVPTVFNTSLKPLVSPNAVQIVNDFKGYAKGPQDSALFFDKLKEYVYNGKVETDASKLRNKYIERG